MHKLAFLIWIIAAPTLMGIFLLVALGVPYFQSDQGFYLMASAIAGAVVAMPISYMVAVKINKIIKS